MCIYLCILYFVLYTLHRRLRRRSTRRVCVGILFVVLTNIKCMNIYIYEETDRDSVAGKYQLRLRHTRRRVT